jgi:NADH-quinone oxidoreductase subunit A
MSPPLGIVGSPSQLAITVSVAIRGITDEINELSCALGLSSAIARLIQCRADSGPNRAAITTNPIMLQNYIPILIFLGVASGIGLVLLGLGFLIGNGQKDDEKLSPYECGFEPFEDSRTKFDVRYYLVAILFIIFDLEIAFLFPWAVSLDTIGLFGLVAMGIFLALLVVGFIYEWKKGALEWD